MIFFSCHCCQLACFVVLAFFLRCIITDDSFEKESSAILHATKGYRLQGHVIRSVLVTSSVECALSCLFDQWCESLNYHHPAFGDMGSTSCEVNNSTREKNEEMFGEDPSTTYYYLMSQVPQNEENTESASPQPVFKSCLDVQTYNNTRVDGEYHLQISYPTCNETIQVYCADMNTTEPSEYISLKAGAGNNFSKRNYVGSGKQDTSGSTKTEFSKIRINSDLTVARGDYKFAAITWWYHKKVNAPYASAADCYQYSCSATKKGVFKMDLTGTGMQFVTPIIWAYHGYHGCTGSRPNHYTVSSTKQVVSGRCGGFCGGCNAKTLTVKPGGC